MITCYARRGVLVGTVVLALVTGALAADRIETSTFVLTLPDGWTVNANTKPLSARGPKGEALSLSSAALSGQPSAEEAARIMREAEARALTVVQMGESKAGMVTVVPLEKTRTILLLTLELPAAAAPSVDAIRASVVGIRWTK